MDDLRGFSVFARVVETGGFSAAARGLGVSKSTVSKQIARLEDHLGARLLNRTTRRMSPTEVGTAFYQRCIRILAEVEEAELAVSRLHAEPRGTLRVNAPMSFGVLHVAPALAEFMARHPELAVDLTLNDRLVDLVDEGFDVAIRIARLTDSTLIARRLAPFHQVVCAAPAYWARHGRPSRPGDLKDHNCLIYTYQQVPEEWPFQGLRGRFSVGISGNLHANNGDVLRHAALGGLGVYLGPAFIVGDDLRRGDLVPVFDDLRETDRAIYAVYPHSRHLSAKVRVFVDFLAARFGPHPYWDAAAR